MARARKLGPWTASALLGPLLLTGCGGVADPATAPPEPSSTTTATSSAPVPSSPSPTSSPSTPVATPSGAGLVVVLDAGHNGGNAKAARRIAEPVEAGGFTKPCNTTGTETDDGFGEHQFTFDVTRRAAALLETRGVEVVLTRADDTGVGPCVDQRAAIANRAQADLAVSVHADGGAAAARGFHVIVPALAPDRGNQAILAPSGKAGQQLLGSFEAATGSKRATYPGALVAPGLTRRSDLAGLNLARVPAVMIECANLRNSRDAALARDPAWRQKAAQGIADGVLAALLHP